MCDRRFWFLVAVSVVAAVSRIIPHPMNFAPMTALALFGGATFASRRAAFLVPLAALLLSDCLLQATYKLGWQTSWGFYPGQWLAYACMAATIGLGALIRGRAGVPMIAAATLAGSLLFFLVTNFPGQYGLAWWNPVTPAGISTSYADAIPFFRNALLGNAVYATLMFGSLALAEARFPSLRGTRSGSPALAA